MYYGSVKMVYNRQSCRKAPQAFISCLISFMYKLSAFPEVSRGEYNNLT